MTSMATLPRDVMVDLRELAHALDVERDGRVTGVHPKEERQMYRARAMQSRYLTRYLYRLDDTRDVDTPIARARAAKRHPRVMSALDSGHEPLGSYDHLDSIMYREAKKAVDPLELARLVEIEEDREERRVPTPIHAAALAAGVSRTTEWRRRRQAAA